MSYLRLSSAIASFVAVASLLVATDARAYIDQADGTVVPQSTRLQQCLDRAGTGETMAGAVSAIADAQVLPEAYRPVLDVPSGHYRVTFVDIGEGAGYRNSFGWYWIGTDVTNPANLHTIFGCRTYATCDCPCATTRTVSVDFDTQTGFVAGRPIGFWLRTPELLVGGNEGGTFTGAGCPMDVGCDPAGTNVADSCGGRNDTNNRIYFTSAALNDDGDYKHFLVYRSATRVNTYYFGFEDLYRGGDNDFEDMLVRGTGLVPDCDPRAEACDSTDNDCDGLIDEGVTQSCSTACGTGVRTCTAGSFGACSARVPGTETCNNVDDNCNGSTDEGLSRACTSTCGTGTEICIAGTYAGCTAPTPGLEICDGVDNDCDGRIDESITRACASSCGSGVETCMYGLPTHYGGCTAPMPSTEVCNGLDDNCNGQVDEGITRACSTACGAGTEVCVAGSYVGCTAPTPNLEACNGIDDDCDGMIDESLVRACSTACGAGTEHCDTGSWVGCDAPTPTTEVCNALDDDCDGVVDDGNPGGGASCVPLPDGGIGDLVDGGGTGTDGGVVCTNGRVTCVDGALVCQGSTTGTREVCNCLDDDCDGQIDEEATGSLCPGGLCLAAECQCVDPCGVTEFAQCPAGEICDESLADPRMGIRGYCVQGMCVGVDCMGMEVCNPLTGICEDPCDGVTCGAGLTCVGGACVSNDCYGLGCPSGQVCRTGTGGTPSCVADPCASTTCATGSFCVDGTCMQDCDGGCRTDQICNDGTCEAAPCGGHCTVGESCIDGTCQANRCMGSCGRGRVCRGTTCVDDACATVSCPSGFTCREGDCYGTGVGVAPVRGLAAGGGLLCAASPGTGGAQSGLGAILLALVAIVVRRGRRRAALAAALGIAVAFATSGCSVEPYCFTCSDDARAGGDAGDAGRDGAVDANTRVDGCVASGTETCNGLDDDCNGTVDDGFDLNADPGNCGRCGNVCAPQHAFAGCSAGSCVVDHCQMGWHDIDGMLTNGCEYQCPPSGDEICDRVDNDCDTRIDEGIDTVSSIANCGSCGNVCSFPGGTASCVSSVCVMSGCRAGFVDLDHDPGTGCEYRCTPTGAETCNGVDDDCNGTIDDGFDTMSDPMHCGTCGTVCSFPHATPHCGLGVCTFGPGDCQPGFYDVDGNPLTGCEYTCTPTGTADTCDGLDQDCDGRIDEAEPMIGTSCGTATGACSTGTTVCVLGALGCSGDIGPTSETCNNVDDDCDGRTDESTAAEPIPTVGDRCGTSNVGRCRFGSVVCTAGALTCGGALVGPIAETCNGVDDDCNGAVDDGLTAPAPATVASCMETRGVCAGRTPTCRGASGWACDFPATYQAVETLCDTLNNDCDGQQDEGCLNPSGAADLRLSTERAAGTTNALDPTITGTGSGATARIHAAWRNVFDATATPRAHVFTSRSTDGGATFGASTLIDTSSGPVFAPRLALPGATNVLWGWPDFRGGTSYREIMTRRSTDGGATLAATAVKANALGATATLDSYNLSLATSGTNVYAAYEAFTGTRQRHVFVARSTDAGATWTTPLQLSTPTATTFVAAEPKIAAAGANVYVAWRDNRSGSLDVFVRSSTDSGATFGTEQRVDLGTAAGSSSSFAPAVAASGNAAWVVWIDDRDAGSFDVWMNRTSDSGATWLSGAVQLDQDPLHHDSIEPHVISPAAGVVLVGWLDYRFGQPDPYVTRSSDGGATFAAPLRVDTGTSPGASASHDIAIGASGSLVAAVWSDSRSGLTDIYSNFSLDQGVTWQPQDYRLDTTTAGTSDSQQPDVWVTSAGYHVVWVDHRGGANGDIYYRRVQ